MNMSKAIVGVAVAAWGAWAAPAAGGAVILAFDNNLAGNPFGRTVMDDQTLVAGAVTDPDFNGGTSATITLFDPVRSVGYADPANPDFTTATASFFGTEASGFGVGDTTTGRFDRGESFKVKSSVAFSLDTIAWRELTGDETLHIRWTQNGSSQSDTFATPNTTPGRSATYVVSYGIVADADTEVIITNVSPLGTGDRLRALEMTLSLVPEPASLGLLALGSAGMLRRARA